MAQPLLEGNVVDSLNARQEAMVAEITRLERQNRQLDEALRLERIKSQTLESGARELRDTLAPLYKSLRYIFGDLQQMGITDVPTGPSPAPQFDPKWKAWIEKFGGSAKAPSRVIQAILDHGPLSRSQLRQATKAGWSTLDEATARLKNLQLIEKSGDRWNLKS